MTGDPDKGTSARRNIDEHYVQRDRVGEGLAIEVPSPSEPPVAGTVITLSDDNLRRINDLEDRVGALERRTWVGTSPPQGAMPEYVIGNGIDTDPWPVHDMCSDDQPTVPDERPVSIGHEVVTQGMWLTIRQMLCGTTPPPQGTTTPTTIERMARAVERWLLR
jgi:hypothetical protein